ncbi:MAG TPA: hypothetical protein VKG23_08655 [Thermoanaerobaculia bacterium]|nr:hypothetical protein [Thermoanaerobaculia bacterium]
MAARSRLARPRRLWIWAIAVLVALPPLFLGAYGATTRWLLTGPKLRGIINEHPESFTIDWDEARSTWPGRVRIRNLRLVGSDPNVEWTVRLENAELRYSVLALVRRTFLCEQLVGSGLAFALRSKLDPKEAKTVDLSLLPEIPGFSDPPLKSPNDRFRVDTHPWLVNVRHVAIDRFEDIWVNDLRYQGLARVEGGFLLRPMHLARIGPALVRFDGGSLRIGKASEPVTLTGTLATTTMPFEPRENPLPEALKQFTIDLKAEIRTPHLQTLGEFVKFPEGVQLEGKGPVINATATVRDGVAEGRAAVAIRGGAARTRTYVLRGDLDADVPVKKWNLMVAPSLDISGTKLALTDVRASGAEESRDWWGRFEVPAGRIGTTASGHVEAHCRDARPLMALLGVELPGWTRGLLKLDGFDATASVSATPGTIRVRDLDAAGGDFKILGRFAHDGKVARGAFLIESGILVIGVEVTPVGTKVRPLFARQWWEKLPKEDRPAAGG